jgi:prolyl oligopeptidase
MGDPKGMDRRDLAGRFADDRIAQHTLRTSPESNSVVDRVERGDGGEYEIFVRPKHSNGIWKRISALDDKCVGACPGWDDDLWILSRKEAPLGQILHLNLSQGASVADATRIISEGEAVIDDFTVTQNRIWVIELVGGPSRVRVFDKGGAALSTLPVLPVSTVTGLRRVGDGEVVYANESFTEPRAWWLATESVPEPSITALVPECNTDFSEVDVTRGVATSYDGTQVPFTVLQKCRASKDRACPTILLGYGGYGIPIQPDFDPTRLLWLEQGGAIAIANVRGGGEFGDEWHLAGCLARKQNVFDDFAACARCLVEDGVCRPDQLALKGGSNGGLLVGAILTQHPDLARVAILNVPVLDMLRLERHPNGAYNVTEFGTVTERDQFNVLLSYSPYHKVVSGLEYPAVMLATGEFDPRVDPYHAKKMTARLQAATTSGRPVLLRVVSAGHGQTSSLDQRIEELADMYSFTFDQLNMGYEDVTAGPMHPVHG